MTVAELIQKLQTLDQNKEVMVRGYEGGVSSISSKDIVEVGIKRDANKGTWYYGEHDYDKNPWSTEEYPESAYLIDR